MSTGITDIHSYIVKSRIVGIYFPIKRLWHCLNLFTSRHQIFTARKRSLGQGNIFTGVCLSRGVSVWCHFLSGCLVPSSFCGVSRGYLSPVRYLSRKGLYPGGLCPGGSPWQNPAPPAETPPVRWRAVGTHPTGMLSCYRIYLWQPKFQEIKIYQIFIGHFVEVEQCPIVFHFWMVGHVKFTQSHLVIRWKYGWAFESLPQ